MLVQIFLQDFRAKKNRNVKGKFKKKKTQQNPAVTS